MSKVSKEDALKYHSEGKAGKIEVIPTKPYSTQRDLSLAYTPGVAEPCLEIEQDAEKAYEYTAKGNLVAVISNGTAVLGLGDIGALAGKPVMEGKGLLFKIFAGIDVFDIEVNEKDPDKFIAAVKAISPTFGGINLEDIKAPECFEIETRLKEELNIPVMHDDQHGTAIISGAGLLNALDIQGNSSLTAPEPQPALVRNYTWDWALKKRTSSWWTAKGSSAPAAPICRRQKSNSPPNEPI